MNNLIKKLHTILKKSKQSILDWNLHYKSKGIEPKIKTKNP
jgi:hypothetical protein